MKEDDFMNFEWDPLADFTGEPEVPDTLPSVSQPYAAPQSEYRGLDHLAASSQDAASFSQTPLITESLDSTPPKYDFSRPGVHEHRNDSEPVVYRELDSFPSFDDPIPAEASIEEICVRYPNHLRGSKLDAFIQWRWTGTDIFNHLSDTAWAEFESSGVARCKDRANRANVFGKRLDARLSVLTADEIAALCREDAPKLRGCLMNGGEHYGGSKLKGKFHNPRAPAIRSYPQRQGKSLHNRASASAAFGATRTFVINGKECLLWNIVGELEIFKTTMARKWESLRYFSDLLLKRDTLGEHRDQYNYSEIILRMVNWPVNRSTETIFSFRHIEDCPTFIGIINDMVEVVMTSILNDPSAGAIASTANISNGQRLTKVRMSAVAYVVQAQDARISRLKGLLAELESFYPGLTDGVVKHVLDWNENVVPELAPPMEAQRLPQNWGVEHSVTFEQPIDQNVLFAGTNPIDTGLPVGAEPMPYDMSSGDAVLPTPPAFNESFTEPAELNVDPAAVEFNFNAPTNFNFGPPMTTSTSHDVLRGSLATSHDTTAPNMFSNVLTATNVTSAARQHRKLARRPAVLKQQREKLADRVKQSKRSGLTDRSAQQFLGFVDAGLGAGVAFDTALDVVSDTMPFNTGPAIDPSQLAMSEDYEVNQWPQGNLSEWPEIVDGQIDWSSVSLDDYLDQQDLEPNTLPDQAISGVDVALSLELPVEDVYRELDLEVMSGLEGSSTANLNVTTGGGDIAEGGPEPHTGAGSNDYFDLPTMSNDDASWLDEAIRNAEAGPQPDGY